MNWIPPVMMVIQDRRDSVLCWTVGSLLYLSGSLQGSSSIGLVDSCFGTFDIELWHHTAMATYNSDHGLFSPKLKSP